MIDTTLPTGVTPQTLDSGARAREHGNVVFVTVLKQVGVDVLSSLLVTLLGRTARLVEVHVPLRRAFDDRGDAARAAQVAFEVEPARGPDRRIDPLCCEQTAEGGYAARARCIEKQAGGPRRNRGTRATPRETTAAVRAPGQDGDVGGLSLTSV